MSRILVVADDFTGAAEMGGIAAAFGLTAQIACGHLLHTSSDALIVNTDTRHLHAGEAAQRLQSLLAQVDPGEFEFVYKKTDSVLRGPVAAELKTVAQTLGRRRSLLIPQNPSRGRTIERGNYFIDGVELHRTSFAGDPEFPAGTARVRKLLDPQNGFEVHALTTHERLSESGIAIGDGNSEADVDRWASQLTDDTLAAGGADFFAAILRRRKLVLRALPPVPVETIGALFICGSASSESRRITGRLARTCLMSKVLFDAGVGDDVALEAWREVICSELQGSGRAVVAVGHPCVPERAANVRRLLGEIAARVMNLSEVPSLFIEGGATAAAVILQLGWRDLTVIGQLSPGVAVLRPLAEPGRTLVVKPGSYPWPAKLLE